MYTYIYIRIYIYMFMRSIRRSSCRGMPLHDSEQTGNDFKRFKDSNLKANAIIWP